MVNDNDTSPANAADMTPEQVAALFNDQFSDMKSTSRERVPFLPRIALTHPRTEYKQQKGVEVGDWYLTPAEQVAEGEARKYENLGKQFECVVLHSTIQVSTRDDDENRTLVESTEFQSFTGEPIMLFDARQGPMHVAAIAPYAGNAVHTISKLRKDPSWPQKLAKDGKTQVSALGLRFNVYVVLPDGRLCVVSNTKRGYWGTNEKTGETCDFDAVAADSFLRARADCHKQTPGLTLGHRWKIMAVHVGGPSDEPRPAFEILGIQDPSKVKMIRAKSEELQQWLQARWSDRIAYAWNNTSPSQREALLTAYTEVRPMLDRVGGAEAAASMFLGRKQAPALLSQPEQNYRQMENENAAEVAGKVKELEHEVDRDAGAPIDVPAINYQSDVKPEDLPF